MRRYQETTRYARAASQDLAGKVQNAVLKPAQVPVRLQAGAGCGCGAGANTEVSQRYA